MVPDDFPGKTLDQNIIVGHSQNFQPLGTKIGAMLMITKLERHPEALNIGDDL